MPPFSLSTGHLWVGRLRFEPLGKYPNHQTDLKRVQDPLIKFAIGYSENQDLSAHSRALLRRRLERIGTSDVNQATAFFGLMWNGFNFLTEYHQRTISPQDVAFVDEDSTGYYIQAGYLLPGDQWEIAGRYEDFTIDDVQTDDEAGLADGDRTAFGIGLNRFLSGHRHKIQADVFDIETRLGEETLDQLRVRLQWQVKF